MEIGDRVTHWNQTDSGEIEEITNVDGVLMYWVKWNNYTTSYPYYEDQIEPE